MATVSWSEYLWVQEDSLASMRGPYKVYFQGEVHDTEVRYVELRAGLRKQVRAYKLLICGGDGQQREVHRRYSQFSDLAAATPSLAASLPPKRAALQTKRFREARSAKLAAMVAQAIQMDPFALMSALRFFLGLGFALPGRCTGRQCQRSQESMRRHHSQEVTRRKLCQDLLRRQHSQETLRRKPSHESIRRQFSQESVKSPLSRRMHAVPECKDEDSAETISWTISSSTSSTASSQ